MPTPTRPTRLRAAALTTAASLLLALPVAAAEELLDGIAAQVGDRIVLVSEVLRSVSGREAAMRQQGAPESEIFKLRADGLESLIESRLIEDIIEDSELYATDEEINRTIEGIAEENGLSLEQLYASVVFHGLSAEDYRKQIKQDLERRNLVNSMIGSKVTIEEEDIEALYKERFSDQPEGGEAVRVRQLLVVFGGPAKRDKGTACAAVGEAKERIDAGDSFEDLARMLSDVAPRDGGDIGWLHTDTIAPWMSDALAPLEPGGVSDVLELPFGCSILQLVERKEFQPITLEQAKDDLAREVWERKVEEGYREWMEQLREENYIERRGYFADAAQFGESTFSSATRERQ